MKATTAAVVGLTVLSRASARTIEVTGARTPSVPHPLQTAINLAMPGDTVLLQPGLYFEDIRSIRDGKSVAPITVKGPASAVIYGAKSGRPVVINHDYIHLEGFSINGSGDQADDYLLDSAQYQDHLIHVHGDRVRVVEREGHKHRSGVVGFRATKLTLSNAGSTCLKLSYFVTHAKVLANNFVNCGMSALKCEGDTAGCGRGTDIGTPLSHRMEGLGGEVDESAWNSVKDNSFHTVGGACVMVHEGAQRNLIESNTCIDSKNAAGAGIVLNGDANIIRYNAVSGAAGAAIAVGGVTAGNHRFGSFNQVYHNHLASNAGGTILNGTFPDPAGMVCLNVVDDDMYPQLAKSCPKLIGSKPDDGNVDGATNEFGDSSHGQSPKGNTAADEPVLRASKRTPSDDYVCHPVSLTAADVTSSKSEDGVKDNCPGSVVLDSNPDTHWSRFGIGQWLEFNLDSAAGPPTVEAMLIKFFLGKERVVLFQIAANSTEVVSEGVSSGNQTKPELFMFREGGIKAETMRYVGLGFMPTDMSKPFSGENAIDTITLCQTTPAFKEAGEKRR